MQAPAPDPAPDPAPRAEPPERWFSLLGLTVVRKTDLLAAAAFLISVTTIMLQAYGFLRGPRPHMFAPDTVYVYFDHYADRSVVTRLAGQVSFTNSGDPGASAVVRAVSVTLQADRLRIVEPWFSFAEVTRRANHLDVIPREAAHPVVVAGGGAQSMLINFAPALIACGARPGCDERADYVDKDRFLAAIDRAGGFTLVVGASLVDRRKSLRAICTVAIGRRAFATLAENGWFAARCTPRA